MKFLVWVHKIKRGPDLTSLNEVTIGGKKANGVKSEILELWIWIVHQAHKPDQRHHVTLNKRCASSCYHRCSTSSLHLWCSVTEALTDPPHWEHHQNSPEICHLKEEFGSWTEMSKARHYFLIQLSQPVSLLSYVISSCWHITSKVIFNLSETN